MLNQQTSHRGVVPFHLYDLPQGDLSVYAGVIISNFVDEPFLYEHKHYLKKGREKTITEQDTEQFTKLKQELSDRALLLPQDELLSVRRIS
ncbi:hypothetical protein ACT8ZS_33995 [Paenibacillus sp. M.A.Huq-84]